ncbi:alpha-amylase family glycosyl hydrolase [Rummeliibacillus pycnus]|uniref:alpha-amylase family glycosyl hydrolase n=1 Tax=Rummeliibacillus pycnus TaxID=101070 RepID=UPI000C9B8485|nr:alpha-amylase family glycosyl hydrolase [Rummeliibacillus pycnus]
MNVAKWISSAVATVLLTTTISSMTIAHAEERNQQIKNESIYDVLVDRFFDKSVENDYNINAKDPKAFHGGDFAGIDTKIDYLHDLDFTMVSMGSVFSSETYDGNDVVDYSKIERNFGTSKEFKALLNNLHKNNIKAMVDFPINHVSKNHVWTLEENHKDWYTSTNDNRINWKTNRPDVQQALINAVVDFVGEYKVDGIRLTHLGNADSAFINKVIAALKKQNKNLYVISNEDSDANFDMDYKKQTIDTYQSIFKNVDEDSSKLEDPFKAYVNGEVNKPTALMIDDLNSARFTHASAEENMFPPTRIKVAVAAVMTMPGVPIVTYGTEIAQNGVKAPETHSALDFRTKDDIISYIGDLQSLRNKSETLRTGNYKLLENKNGLIVFERYSDDEKWIVMINNTDKTQRYELDPSIIGKNKELHGLFESDTVRQNDNGKYNLVIDREVAELYHVTEHKGINIPYMIALGLVYVIFIGFIIALLRRGRRK